MNSDGSPSDAAQVRQRFSPAPAFGTARYPDDTHSLTPMASLADGLRFVFAPVSLSRTVRNDLKSATPDSTMWMQALDALESTYIAGARTLRARDLGLTSDLLPEIVNRESASTVSSTAPLSLPAHFGAPHVIASRLCVELSRLITRTHDARRRAAEAV